MGGTKSTESQDPSAQNPDDQQAEFVRLAEEDRRKAKEDLKAAKAETQAEAEQASTTDK